MIVAAVSLFPLLLRLVVGLLVAVRGGDLDVGVADLVLNLVAGVLDVVADVPGDILRGVADRGGGVFGGVLVILDADGIAGLADVAGGEGEQDGNGDQDAHAFLLLGRTTRLGHSGSELNRWAKAAASGRPRAG